MISVPYGRPGGKAQVLVLGVIHQDIPAVPYYGVVVLEIEVGYVCVLQESHLVEAVEGIHRHFLQGSPVLLEAKVLNGSGGKGLAFRIQVGSGNEPDSGGLLPACDVEIRPNLGQNGAVLGMHLYRRHGKGVEAGAVKLLDLGVYGTQHVAEIHALGSRRCIGR